MKCNNNKIRVCHVVASLTAGGMENGVINLCNGINRDRYELMVCCMKKVGSMADRLKPDVEIIDLNFQEGKAPFRPISMAKFFMEVKPDIVHTHGWGGGSFDGVIGAKLVRSPKIVNGEHGSFFLTAPQVLFQKVLFSLCDKILAVSESLREKVVKYFRVSPDKIIVIPNGVDIDVFHGQHNKSRIYAKINRDGFFVQPDNFIIAFIGSLRSIKNNKMLLKAIKYISDNDLIPGMKVLFIGDGPEKDQLESYCKNCNLKGNVYFLGKRNDLPELYSIIDVLTLCSHSEGMSNVLLEAMSSGVPVICTEGSDIKKEIVSNGFNGFRVANNDVEALVEAIIKIHDDEVRRKVARNAKNFIRENYSIVRMIREYENFYLSLMSNNLHAC